MSTQDSGRGGLGYAAKLAPHRPGIAPALGLRAGSDVHYLFRRPAWGILDDYHRIRNSLAVAADWRGNLARVDEILILDMQRKARIFVRPPFWFLSKRTGAKRGRPWFH